MTNQTVCAIGRTCAQSAAAVPALPARAAGAGAWLPAIARNSGKGQCPAGLTTGLIFNY
jgi:hypothetical protein